MDKEKNKEEVQAKIQALRGMKDLVNDDGKKYLYIVNNISKIASRYGFDFIKNPILEQTSLFRRSVGQSSDIVHKEMYQFLDKGNNDVCLRPEGTAGIMRSFIQNKLDKAGGIHRYFYYGPMFRYERPQKGRFRQFHQFGCESIGQANVYEDANIILMLGEIFNFLNIDFTLELNSLGCEICMPKYKNKLIEFLQKEEELLCDDCKTRLKTNPIRVLDCKNQKCKEILTNAPKLSDNLCETCSSDFMKLQDILKTNGFSFLLNEKLVRGLDYYTKTAFEFVSTNIGAQNALSGGGRYDKLCSMLGGVNTPAIGFAIGIERLMELVTMKPKKEDFIYLGFSKENSLETAFSLAIRKRKSTKSFIEYKPKSFTKHITNAKKMLCTHLAFIGEDEEKNNTILLKSLENNEEVVLSLEKFCE